MPAQKQKTTMLPIDVATEQTLDFLDNNVKLQRRRVLEVGCGEGDLAKAIKERGAEVLALDERSECTDAASAKGVRAVQCDFIKYRLDEPPFDIVIFARSLHHIRPLELAVKRTREFLSELGVVVVEDFAADRASEQAIEWLQQKYLEIPAECKSDTESHYSFPRSLEGWNHHHFNKHTVATSTELLAAVHDVFRAVSESAPAYLYRYLINEVKNTKLSADYITKVLHEEIEMIESKAFAPIGLRLVGHM